MISRTNVRQQFLSLALFYKRLRLATYLLSILFVRAFKDFAKCSFSYKISKLKLIDQIHYTAHCRKQSWSPVTPSCIPTACSRRYKIHRIAVGSIYFCILCSSEFFALFLFLHVRHMMHNSFFKYLNIIVLLNK